MKFMCIFVQNLQPTIQSLEKVFVKQSNKMKNNRKHLIVALLALPLCTTAQAEKLSLSTPTTSIVVDATKGEPLKFVYYGCRLSASDIENLTFGNPTTHDAYPTFGLSGASEAALSVRHADGNLTLKLGVESIDRAQDGHSQTLRIKMKDLVYPLYVTVCYRAYSDVDIIESWSEISNEENKVVTLRQFASSYLPIRRGDVWVSHLYGSWANEAQVSEEPLKPGTLVIENRDGTRNAHTSHAEVMFSLDGKAHENDGRVIGAAMCYSGNYKLRINTNDSEYHKFFAGIDEYNSEYRLRKGEKFATPVTAFSYSEEGLSGVSRNFHKWGREYMLAHGDKQRKILLNSWEGVYFNINEEGMSQMMGDIASMGGELFVMDDGWFGDKYKRNTDNSSLGDWVVDTSKLPNGIDGLISEAKKKGVKFGIWLEPEMTNTTSELFEKHPDWVIRAPRRELVLGRGGTQLVLDLSNPKVQDFVFGVVDDMMSKHPGIDYIKWDANMDMSSYGSQYLSADEQSHLNIDYHRGFINVCKKIREKYPDLTIQACASGGGRANWGFLPYFDEFWVSDNTDALQRIYMQWGTSYFYPAIAMGSHISAAPNHQTFRTIPLKFRIDVAMSGRLGMEIQPKNMTDEEKELCKRAISSYKQIRPVVQFGNIYRLLSPYDHLGAASLMYVDDAKSKAVFYWWKTETFVNQHIPRVKMAGLDPNKQYTVSELVRIDNKPLSFEGKTFSGEYLMSNGLEIPYTHDVDYNKLNDYSSRVLLIEAK